MKVRIWDWPIRLAHWALVVLIPFAWWTYKTDRMDWHKLAGYAVLAILAFRLFWGLFGSETARFAHFLRGPRAAWRYMTQGVHERAGHNPIGGWSIVLMLVVLIAQTGAGLFASDENGLESGPFADWVTLGQAALAQQIHGLLFDVLLAVIALHIAAIFFYLLRGRNLIGPMITGRARLPEGIAAPRQAGVFATFLGLAVFAAMFLALRHWGR